MGIASVASAAANKEIHEQKIRAGTDSVFTQIGA
jgi:hypothetical protein